MADESAQPKPLNGHRLSEFIYGTVTGMVAVVGIDSGADASGWEALLIVVAGAAAIWVAHAYATLMSHRITSGRRAEGRDLVEALRSSWPVVSAGLLLAAPLLGVVFGVYALQTGLGLSSIMGVLILALIGIAAGIVTHETWPRRIVLVLLSCGLGLAIVVIELAVHH